ncbi:MAG: hypothetical protein KA782_00190 [Flavobacterium sp.]|nr:hypothetical protein [Flavobacterium sp.]
MEEKFEIKINDEVFYFVIDKNRYVWYLDKDNNFIKVTNTIYLKAKDLEEAKSIGKKIIYTMGYTE